MNARHIFVATGAYWAADTAGRHDPTGLTHAIITSADHLLAGSTLDADHVAIYDDDHHYLGSVLALLLRKRGQRVTLITPAGRPCAWGAFTEEQHRSTTALVDAGVSIITNRVLSGISTQSLTLSGHYGEAPTDLACDALIPVTRRIPDRSLYDKIRQTHPDTTLIGDAEAPGLIAAAVHSGYRAALQLDAPALNFARREVPF